MQLSQADACTRPATLHALSLDLSSGRWRSSALPLAGQIAARKRAGNKVISETAGQLVARRGACLSSAVELDSRAKD